MYSSNMDSGGLHNSPTDMRAHDELIKRIRKLRWIGCVEEADRLLGMASRTSGKPLVCPIERETD